MKTFKRIYYPALAGLLLLSLILTIALHSNGGGGGNVSSRNAFEHAQAIAEFGPRGHGGQAEITARNNARDYIIGVLDGDNSGFEQVVAVADEPITFALADGNPVPTFAVIQERVSGNFDGTVAAGIPVENIIAIIPGSATRADNAYYGQAVVMLASYDTAPITGGAGNASTAGALLETALTLASNQSRYNFEHDIVIAFTSGGIWGQTAVLQTTETFGNLSSRVGFAVEFDARSNRGSLALYEATLGAAAAFTRANGSINAVSAADFAESSTAFYDIPSLRFAALGGARFEGGTLDTSPSRRISNQTAAAAYNLSRYLGNANLDSFVTERASATYTYLNISFTYNNIVGFVLVGIIIALAGLLIVFNVLKLKNAGEGKLGNAISKLLIAFFVQLIAFVIASAVLFVAYAVFSVIAMGFGVILPQAFGRFTFGNAGLIIGLMLLASAALIGAYILFKRLFNIKSADLARGNLVIWTIAALVTGIFFTQVSYLFIIMAILQLAISLTRTFTKDIFQTKTGMRMDALLLPAIPMLITLPLLLPILLTAGAYVPTLFMPFIFVMFSAWAGFVLSYFELTKPLMEKVFLKLPSYPVRYERTVTEKVEDKAKKGKFKEVTGKKIIVEKRKFTYKNRISIVAIAIISAIVIICSSFFAGRAGSQTIALGNSDLFAPAYNEALVYEYNNGQVSWVVADINAFRRYRRSADGFSWNSDDGVFVRQLTDTERDYRRIAELAPTITRDYLPIEPVEGEYSSGWRFDFTRSNSTKRLVLNNTSNVTMITLVIQGVIDPIEIPATDLEYITIELPSNILWFYIMADEPSGVMMNFSQYIINTPDLNAMETFSEINRDLVARGHDPLRANMVFRMTRSM
ncbi:MAG: hypothetical protein FWC80_04165 [Firmicutes bacterium]|nr:hypothetical protein [Bacillota bacterium]